MSLATPTQDVFKVIADPTRRAILDLLVEQSLPVSDICSHFALTQGAVSQHLKVLRDVGLVSVKKIGRKRIYAASPLPLLEVFTWLLHYKGFWNKRLDGLDNVLEQLKDSE